MQFIIAFFTFCLLWRSITKASRNESSIWSKAYMVLGFLYIVFFPVYAVYQIAELFRMESGALSAWSSGILSLIVLIVFVNQLPRK